MVGDANLQVDGDWKYCIVYSGITLNPLPHPLRTPPMPLFNITPSQIIEIPYRSTQSSR